tara:strand:+ start:557 stop:1624 length:1068 start_codon:yes stop_codon:yes gene_type:complete
MIDTYDVLRILQPKISEPEIKSLQFLESVINLVGGFESPAPGMFVCRGESGLVYVIKANEKDVKLIVCRCLDDVEFLINYLEFNNYGWRISQIDGSSVYGFPCIDFQENLPIGDKAGQLALMINNESNLGQQIPNLGHIIKEVYKSPRILVNEREWRRILRQGRIQTLGFDPEAFRARRRPNNWVELEEVREGHCNNCRFVLEECQGCNANLICNRCEIEDINGVLCSNCRQPGICVNCREEVDALYSCRTRIGGFGELIGNCGIECLCNDCSDRNQICRTCDIDLCECGIPHGGITWHSYCACGIKRYCLNCEPTDNLCNGCNEVTDWKCSTQYSSQCRHGENCNYRDFYNRED